MPGGSTVDEIELIIEDVGGGGGGKPPMRDGGDDGDDRDRRPDDDSSAPSPRRYYTGITLAIVSILMFFMALASAYIFRRAGSNTWVPVSVPPLMWVNTVVLLASSATLEIARKRLARGDSAGYRKFWIVTIVLGMAFLAGQVAACRELVKQGVYLSSNPGSSFLYIFTGAHGLHLLGGVTVLVYVSTRKFERAKLSRAAAAEITSFYWHFMDVLWLFLLALLFFGK
ncbi:MAG: cytochrome oxidase subunit III [Proteobacteria bacterium]|nr:MAG: cytochrome oxidase subunit III [Pseudomonadota bacterium]